MLVVPFPHTLTTVDGRCFSCCCRCCSWICTRANKRKKKLQAPVSFFWPQRSEAWNNKQRLARISLGAPSVQSDEKCCCNRRCHDAFPHLPHPPLFVVSSSAGAFFDGCLRACVDGLLGFSSCLLCLVLRRFKGFRCCSPRFKLFLLHARKSLFLREFAVHQNSVSFLLLTFVKLRGSRMQEDWRDYYGYGVGRAKNNHRFMSGLPIDACWFFPSGLIEENLTNCTIFCIISGVHGNTVEGTLVSADMEFDELQTDKIVHGKIVASCRIGRKQWPEELLLYGWTSSWHWQVCKFLYTSFLASWLEYLKKPTRGICFPFSV